MYKRIILKLSGETLAPERIEANHSGSVTFDPARVDRAADIIIQLAKLGMQVGVVMGGGNIWRGRFTDEMNPVQADQMGMLATVINALAVQEAILRAGHKAVVYTAQEMTRFAELYRADRAVASMEEGAVVLLAGGTGNPFFTTDTGASLRAIEIRADVMLKGTRVDGVYTADPEKDATAKKFDKITYDEVIARNLKVMDITATALFKENNMPIYVFNMDKEGNLEKMIDGENVGTLVSN